MGPAIDEFRLHRTPAAGTLPAIAVHASARQTRADSDFSAHVDAMAEATICASRWQES